MTAQPKQLTADLCVEENILDAPVVMARAADELKLIVQHCEELESGLLSFMHLSSSTDARAAVQSLDLIHQSLNNLAAFLTTSADQTNRGEVDVSIPLTHVTLGAMRTRLLGIGKEK